MNWTYLQISVNEFFRLYSGYILALLVLAGGGIKEALNYKQRKVIRLEAEATIKETEANAKKSDLDFTEALRESYKKTAEEWKERYDEAKVINVDLIKANKICLENIVKEQEAKAAYVEEIHKLREEVQELKNIILRFQAQFPELFKTISDIKDIK